MPKIALLFVSLHAAMLLILAWRVVAHRRSAKIGIGDGGDKALARKIRVHANFIEYVPIALVLLALLELVGLPAIWLWIFGGTLLLGRILHAVGMSASGGTSFGRFWGTFLTWVVLAAMAVAGITMAVRTL